MLRGSLLARPCRQASPAFGLALRATRSAALGPQRPCGPSQKSGIRRCAPHSFSRPRPPAPPRDSLRNPSGVLLAVFLQRNNRISYRLNQHWQENNRLAPSYSPQTALALRQPSSAVAKRPYTVVQRQSAVAKRPYTVVQRQSAVAKRLYTVVQRQSATAKRLWGFPRANLQFTNSSGRTYKVLSFLSGLTLLQFSYKCLESKYSSQLIFGPKKGAKLKFCALNRTFVYAFFFSDQKRLLAREHLLLSSPLSPKTQKQFCRYDHLLDVLGADGSFLLPLLAGDQSDRSIGFERLSSTLPLGPESLPALGFQPAPP